MDVLQVVYLHVPQVVQELALLVVFLHVPQVVQVDVLLVVLNHVKGIVINSAMIHVILLVMEDVRTVVKVDVEEDGGVPVVV